MDNRKLDALVAQARGWKRDVRVRASKKVVTIYSNNKWFADGQQTEEDLLHYGAPLCVSTDISEAMALVEDKEFDGYTLSRRGTDHVVTLYSRGISHMAKGDTLPDVICLAYLKAKNVEVPNE